MPSLNEHRPPRVETKGGVYRGRHNDGLAENDAKVQDQDSVHSRSRYDTPTAAVQVTIPSQSPPMAMVVPSEEPEARSLAADPDLDVEGGGQGSQNHGHKPSSRNLLDAILSGLRRLPQAVIGKPVRKGKEIVGQAGDPSKYQSPIAPALELPAQHVQFHPTQYANGHSDHHVSHSVPQNHRHTIDHSVQERLRSNFSGDTVGIEQSHEVVEPSFDDARMPMPSRTRTKSFWASRLGRVERFFRELYHLPWVAKRITVDYVRTEQGQMTNSRPTTWYYD